MEIPGTATTSEQPPREHGSAVAGALSLWSRWRSTSWAGRTFVLFNLALLAWYLVRPGAGSGSGPTFICGVVTGGVLGPAVSLVWTLAAWRGLLASRADRRSAWATGLLAAGTLLFLVGNSYYYYLSVVLNVDATPSLADLCFLLAYPCQILAVLIRPIPADPAQDRANDVAAPRGGPRMLDALLASAAIATVSWHFLLAPMIADPQTGRLARVVSASYPMLDLVVLACVLTTSGRTRRPSAVSRLLAAGLAAVAVTDSLYAHALLHNTYANGDLLDLGWPLGYMLVGLATRAMRSSAGAKETNAPSTTTALTTVNGVTPARPQQSPRVDATSQLGRRSRRVLTGLRAGLPYAAFALVAALAFSTFTDHDGPAGDLRRSGAVVGFVVVAALLLARQEAVIRQNAGLNDRLRDVVVQLRQGHTLLATAVETLRQSEERFRIASQCAGDLIYEWDLVAGSLTWFGDIDRLLGHEPGAFPHTLAAWAAAIHPEDRRRVTKAFDRHVETGDRYDVEYRIARADGRYLHWIDRGRSVTGTDGRAARMVGAVSDVTVTKQAQERLRHESLHDALTGLPNRALFYDRVDRCIERARRSRRGDGTTARHYAVLFLDLDRFKLINDSLGHSAGDRLLSAVAERLERCLRGTDSLCRSGGNPSSDGVAATAPNADAFRGVTFAGNTGRDANDDEHTLARLGGDEFTILLESLAAPEDAEAVAARVLTALAEPVPFDGHEVFANASVGVVHGSPDYQNARDLLRDADVAMYRAKAAGRGRVAVFDATMHTEAVARLQLEGDLRRAIDRREMALVYQPVVSLQTGDVVGVEALVRWRKPDGTIVSPADFIPIAEDTGLIVPLGNWVMGEACRQMRAWRVEHPAAFAELTVAVNVSGRQLSDADSLLAMVRQSLATHELPASALKVEITEGVMMEPGAATGVLARLRDAGVSLHMDDFGTGYSSLSRLHCFPIQGLKIDRSFIAQTANGHTSIALLQSIVALSHHLGIQVVAEGVETPEQIALLQTLECDFAQGYHFAKPLGPDQLVTFVATNRARAAATAA